MSGVDHGVVYVIGEHEEPDGPVKIGYTSSTAAKVGRSGLNVGNWRKLEELHRWVMPFEHARWTEFSLHRNLRSRHVRGEWFRVRDLVTVTGGWQPFLEAAKEGSLPGLEPWTVAKGGHRIQGARRLTPGEPRHFVVDCACGHSFDGGEGRSLDTALVGAATEHVGLDPNDPVVKDLKAWKMAKPSP